MGTITPLQENVQTRQRVQCSFLNRPQIFGKSGPEFHGERTKNQLHYLYTTRYCGMSTRKPHFKVKLS